MIFLLMTTLLGMTYNSFAYELCDSAQSSGPIRASLPELAAAQPLFANFVTDMAATPILKSICFTFYPAAKSPGNYQIYKSQSYTNGSSDITPAIGTEKYCGTFGYGNTMSVERVEVFGYERDCQTFILCTTIIYGTLPNYCFGISSTNKPISQKCLDSAFKTLRRNGHLVVKHRELNMTDASTCITCQGCSINN